MTRIKTLGLISLSMLFALGSANAALITFSGTDPGAGSASARPNSDAAAAAFTTAASGLGAITLVDFESAPLGAFSNLVISTGVTMNGTDVTSSNQTIRNSPFDSPDSLFGFNTTAGGSRFVSFYGGTVTFAFSSPVQAFGVYLSGVQLGGETFAFNDGTSQVLNIPNPGNGVLFFGFTDAGQGISNITIDVAGDIIGLDDVRWVSSAAAAVPEPATLFLSASAIAGLWLLRRAKAGSAGTRT